MRVCPACGVTITDSGEVLFSAGKPGTKERLYARVCQFAKKEECINTGELKELTESDYYGLKD